MYMGQHLKLEIIRMQRHAMSSSVEMIGFAVCPLTWSFSF